MFEEKVIPLSSHERYFEEIAKLSSVTVAETYKSYVREVDQ